MKPSDYVARFSRVTWLGLIAGVVMLGAIAEGAIAAPCRMYTEDTPDEIGYGYREVNNCPPLIGTFQNEHWQVDFRRWEPAAFFYRGTNRRTGNTIQLIDDEVRGTTDRPQYLFRNANTVYQVTFRSNDPSTIRVEVFQNDRRILNQLLTRIAD